MALDGPCIPVVVQSMYQESLCVQTNMASAMEATLRELYFADGNAVVCLTGSLHVISAAQDLET